MKSFVQQLLRQVGYDVRRAVPDPFTVQHRLIAGVKPVIFDVGAHHGETIESYRQLFPGATIHGFEPFKASFDILQHRTSKDQNILAHNLALSDSEGRSVLNVNEASATNSLLPSSAEGARFWGEGLLETKEQVEVGMTSVDAFCREHEIARVDILKLDVQGHEYAVLSGAHEMLSRQAIGLIYTELIVAPTYKGQRSLSDYLAYLTPLGYELLDIYNPVRRHLQLIQADLIFLSSALMQQARSGTGQ